MARKKARKKKRKLIDKRLVSYSAAAGMAVALSSGAEASIISSTQNPSWNPMGISAGTPQSLTMEGNTAEVRFSTFNIELQIGMPGTGGMPGMQEGIQLPFPAANKAGDGFMIHNFGTPHPLPPVFSTLFGNLTPFARHLTTQNRVGSAQTMPNASKGILAPMLSQVTNTTGPFYTFFGFSFDLESTPQTVYGWGELEFEFNAGSTSGTLLNWAYEDSGGSIQVGDTGQPVPAPSSLGLFALGAAGIAAFRRRKKHKKT